MRIGFFTDTYYPQINGVSVSVDNFAASLRRQGHSVYIYAPKIKKYKDTDPKIVRIPSFKVLSSEPEVLFPLPIPHKSMKYMYQHNFDLIHAHGNGGFSLLGLQIARMKGIPYILTFHNLHTKYTHYIFNGKVVNPRMVATALRVFGNLCDGIAVPSEKMRDELVKYGVKKPIAVIPNFIDPSQFHVEKKGYLHKKFHIKKNGLLLLSVGRLGKEKNFRFVIKVFKKFISKNPSAHLVIVGKGPEKQSLLKLAKSLSIEKNVHFTNQIERKEMPLVYADANVFVFASDSETQGICVLEAAASALPIVINNDRAFEDMVVDTKSGFVLTLKEDLFVNALQKIIDNPALGALMGQHAKDIVAQSFNGNLITAKLISFYSQVLAQYSPRAKLLRRLNKATFVRLSKATQMLNKFLSV